MSFISNYKRIVLVLSFIFTILIAFGMFSSQIQYINIANLDIKTEHYRGGLKMRTSYTQLPVLANFPKTSEPDEWYFVRKSYSDWDIRIVARPLIRFPFTSYIRESIVNDLFGLDYLYRDWPTKVLIDWDPYALSIRECIKTGNTMDFIKIYDPILEQIASDLIPKITSGIHTTN